MKRIFFFGGLIVLFAFLQFHQVRRERQERALNAFKEEALERQQQALAKYQDYLKKVKIYKAKREDYKRQWLDYQRGLEKYHVQAAQAQKNLQESRSPAAVSAPPSSEDPFLAPSEEHRSERDHELDFDYIEQGVTLEDLQRRGKISEQH